MKDRLYKVHAPNPTDLGVSLCSVRREGSHSNDTMLAVVIAEPGQAVTCGHCKALISLVRHYFGPRYVLKKGWRKLETER